MCYRITCSTHVCLRLSVCVCVCICECACVYEPVWMRCLLFLFCLRGDGDSFVSRSSWWGHFLVWCSVLQCVAMCCSVFLKGILESEIWMSFVFSFSRSSWGGNSLWNTPTHSVVQCVAVCCSVLQCVALIVFSSSLWVDSALITLTPSSSQLHSECHILSLKSQSMIFFSRSLLPRSVENRPMRLRLQIEIGWHSKCNSLYFHFVVTVSGSVWRGYSLINVFAHLYTHFVSIDYRFFWWFYSLINTLSHVHLHFTNHLVGWHL